LGVDYLAKLKITTALVELIALNKELKKGVGLLSSVLINLWHVEIINEEDQLLASCLWTILLEAALVNVFFEVLLEVH